MTPQTGPTPEQQAAYDAFLEAGHKLAELMQPTDEERQDMYEEIRDCGWDMLDDASAAAYAFESRWFELEEEVQP